MTELCVRGLCKGYHGVAAVDRLSMTVAFGSRLAVVGASGSGKTTLLRLIAGFERPDCGEIHLGGVMLTDARHEQPPHLRNIGYLTQDGALFPHLTVSDNIGFGLHERGAARARRIDELMAMVALEGGVARQWPHTLSGGQQQRVALARALAQRPRLLLLDEPFSALDGNLRAALRAMVTALLAETGITAILVTHDRAEALSFADQLAVLRRGRLVQMGDPRQLYRYPRDEDIALFLGEAIILTAQIEAGIAQCLLGEIAVEQDGFCGEGRILLRPEQFSLHPESQIPAPQTPEPQTPEIPTPMRVWARVTGCEFGGHDSLLRLSLLESQHCLNIRSSLWPVPETGSRLALAVQGSAHRLQA